jgi:hypothetical protein
MVAASHMARPAGKWSLGCGSPWVVIREGSSRPVWEPRSPGMTRGPGATPWKAWTRSTSCGPDVPEAPEHIAGLIHLNPGAHVLLLSEQGAHGLHAGH